MSDEIVIIGPEDPLAGRLAALVAESEQAGFLFVRRLVEEWGSGANRFSRPGEALFVAEVDGRPVGVCGLSIDPYVAGGRVGRVRHLYVAAAYRRRGIGGRLVHAVVAAAEGVFDRLRLRTDTAAASRFYEARGFQPIVNEPNCTHAFDDDTRRAAMAFGETLARCIDKWHGEAVALAAPIEEAEIRKVWGRLGQPVSRDVLQLYTTLGGFRDYAFDGVDLLWTLWPWSFLIEENTQDPHRGRGIPFCDHSIRVVTWELRFEDEQHSSVWQSEGNTRSAPTLESFFRIYLDDPWRLL